MNGDCVQTPRFFVCHFTISDGAKCRGRDHNDRSRGSQSAVKINSEGLA